MSRRSIAIIGGGAAGLATAYYLRGRHSIRIFEKADRAGGHIYPVSLRPDEGPAVDIDIAFAFFCREDYPTFASLLDELGVSCVRIEARMAVWDRSRGLAFRRADLRSKVPPELSPRFGADSERFLSRAARRVEADADSTLEELLQREEYDADAVRYTIIPPIANLWGFDWRTTMSLSARYSMQEIDRLRLSNRAFRAGTGGIEHIDPSTRAYLDRLTAAVDAEIVTRADVLRVERDGDRVLVVTAAGSERFDAAVLAVHADQALRLLHRPTEPEVRCLSAFTYHHVPAIVHTDTGMLPPDPSLWEHFNYTLHAAAPPIPATSWYLNRIHGFSGRPYFLTVGEVLDRVSREAIVETVQFRHPVMTPAAVAATKHVAELNALGPIYFCGSYTGNGSHEAAIVSAKLVSERLIS